MQPSTNVVTIFPTYEAAAKKRREAQLRMIALRDERQRLEVERFQAATARDRICDAERVSAEVEKFLVGDAAAAPAADAALLVDIDRRIAAIDAELTIISEAYRVANDACRRHESRANAAVAARLRREHRHAIEYLARCALALAEANRMEADIRRMLPLGQHYDLPPVQFPNVGSPSDEHSVIRTWLRRLRRDGLIDGDLLKAAE